MVFTINSNENNPATLKLILAAIYSKKEVEINIVNLNDKNVNQPRHLPYFTLNNEIFFIPNAGLLHLLPPNDAIKSKVLELLEWEGTILSPFMATYLGNNPKNKLYKEKFSNYLKKLDKILEGQEFLVGNTITVCDFSIWALLYPMQEWKESETKNISRWFENLKKEHFVGEALKKFHVETGNGPYQVLVNSMRYLENEVVAIDGETEAEVSEEEIKLSEKYWCEFNAEIKEIEGRNEILPKENEKNILITSALPYVNNVPHLGNIIGCVLSADVFARFSRLRKRNVLYICGTDEYGTATETKALEEGLTCRQICDKYFEIHKSVYDWFGIGFDHFGRTSTPEQTQLAQSIFLKLNDNGFMFTENVEQLHCGKCQRFLADRFVEGSCPNQGCTYPDARGDQCDLCGKLVNAIELKNPRCKICGTTPKIENSTQFFMDLPKLEPLLLHWFKMKSTGWTNNAQTIARSWLKDGLKPRCITRDLKWGIPVPLEGFQNKVFYVWFDAPIGYMSITKNYTKNWEKWWKPREKTDITLYNFMAKDNVPFHSIMFPATLLGCNDGYVTVSHLIATEYLNYEDGKFSKSRNIGVFGSDAQNTKIPCDVWRFYLLYIRPETQDSNFNWHDLATKNNSELLNNLGNFINRALMFVKNSFAKIVPKMNLQSDDFKFLALCNRELKNYVNALENVKLRDGLRHVLAISKHGNQYMQHSKPWVLLKGTPVEKERAGTIVGVCSNIACLISILLSPYMPETCENIRKQLNVPEYLMNDDFQILKFLKEGHEIGEPGPLFRKIEDGEIEELKKKFGGVEEKKVDKESDGMSKDDLESEIARQASRVRELKEKSDKSIWQPEVEKLLTLKNKLAILTGEPIKQGKSGKKKK